MPGVLGNTHPSSLSRISSAAGITKELPYAQAERVGMVGFCFGGGVTWRVATGMPELRAAVPFYGPPPPLEDVPNIQAAVLAIYGGDDQRINRAFRPDRRSHAAEQQDLREDDLPGRRPRFP